MCHLTIRINSDWQFRCAPLPAGYVERYGSRFNAMTLILNEIHLLRGMEETLIVAAADRRVSKPDGSYDSTRRKLFCIPYLHGAIAYFGLAVVYPKGRSQWQYMSEWLLSFIRRHSSVRDLEDFANTLREELNRVVPPEILKKNPSGFHICGYDSAGRPDFWYLSNIGGLKDFKYIDLKSQYTPPESHFLSRDALREFRWDGKDPLSAINGVKIYRNGDFRAHVAAWEQLDYIYWRLSQFPDFKLPKTPGEYGEYVKFKFEIVAYIYKNWAKKQIVARPIDVIVLTRDFCKVMGAH